jgi:hypothetical protein
LNQMESSFVEAETAKKIVENANAEAIDVDYTIVDDSADPETIDVDSEPSKPGPGF